LANCEATDQSSRHSAAVPIYDAPYTSILRSYVLSTIMWSCLASWGIYLSLYHEKKSCS